MEERNGRQYRSQAERRQIVEETLKPGESVSRIARAHNVNTNQVFHWRKQYREGWFDNKEKEAAALVPVRVSPESGTSSEQARRIRRKNNDAGMIEIEWGSVRVRIEGSVDPDCIHAVIEGLSR